MLKDKIFAIIKKGEGLNFEFKECKNSISKDVYETVCAFLNRCGGELLLGVNDSGKLTGIDSSYIEQIKPQLIEEDIFKVIIPLTPQAAAQVTAQDERTLKILQYCIEPRTTFEIMITSN